MEFAAANLADLVFLPLVIDDVEALRLRLGVTRAEAQGTIAASTPGVHLLVNCQHESVRSAAGDRCERLCEPRKLDGCGLQDDFDVTVCSSTCSILVVDICLFLELRGLFMLPLKGMQRRMCLPKEEELDVML